MSETTMPAQPDLADFSLNADGPVTIKMPALPKLTEKDVDAQLFIHITRAAKGEHLHSIADLNDEWVKANYPDMNTIEDLRAAIRFDLRQQRDYDVQNLKFQLCADALVARLEGEISEEILAANAKASRSQYADRLAASGMSKQHYMQYNQMSESAFEEALLEDVKFQLKLNVALDLLVKELGTEIADEQIIEYLEVADEDTFLEEATAKGKLEEARQAAARVMVMRDIVDAAVVEEA